MNDFEQVRKSEVWKKQYQWMSSQMENFRKNNLASEQEIKGICEAWADYCAQKAELYARERKFLQQHPESVDDNDWCGKTKLFLAEIYQNQHQDEVEESP